MKNILKRLIFDSCLRIRNFLLKKINLFKNQKTNSQILKQNLLKFKYYNFFLKKFNLNFYNEVRYIKFKNNLNILENRLKIFIKKLFQKYILFILKLILIH